MTGTMNVVLILAMVVLAYAIYRAIDYWGGK